MKDIKKEFDNLNSKFKRNKIDIGCSYDNKEIIEDLGKEKLKVKLSAIQNRNTVRLEDYIPDESKPLTFICVNIHVFQDSLGRGAFQNEDISRLRQVFEWINHRFSFNYPPNYNPIYTPKPLLKQQIDSRIRFVINKIEFYQDDSLCNTHSDNVLLNAIRQRDPNMIKQLNFLINNPSPPVSYTGHAVFPTTDMSINQVVHLIGARDASNVPEPWSPFGDWFLSLHWCHELGHIFGLCHTYDSANSWWLCARCNEQHDFYIYDVHGLSPNQDCPIPQSAGNNNIMAGAGTEAISTLQIAKMHYALENLTVGKYSKGCCCKKCVAFGAGIFRHKSQGAGVILEYEKTLANEPWAWDGKLFTCPSDGIYNFSVSFQKDSLVDGGTANDVWIKLWAGWDLIGTAWSEKADAKTTGIVNAPQYGRRDSVCFTTNVKLKKGTIVKTEIGSHNNEKRHVVDVNFSGHLLCSDCC